MVFNNDFSCFPNFDKHKHTHVLIKEDIKSHLVRLGKKLKHCFPRLDSSLNEWVINPFTATMPKNLTFKEKEELIKLSQSKEMELIHTT